mmetsp:Transcript_23394/g.76019  ORF Transcript_23394/g.76019 Transcript_23394/m.76019 type:complete len:1170 (-) Transcript_23394:1860-5369(-)
MNECEENGNHSREPDATSSPDDFEGDEEANDPNGVDHESGGNVPHQWRDKMLKNTQQKSSFEVELEKGFKKFSGPNIQTRFNDDMPWQPANAGYMENDSPFGERQEDEDQSADDAAAQKKAMFRRRIAKQAEVHSSFETLKETDAAIFSRSGRRMSENQSRDESHFESRPVDPVEMRRRAFRERIVKEGTGEPAEPEAYKRSSYDTSRSTFAKASDGEFGSENERDSSRSPRPVEFDSGSFNESSHIRRRRMSNRNVPVVAHEEIEKTGGLLSPTREHFDAVLARLRSFGDFTKKKEDPAPRITRFLAKHSFAGPEQLGGLLKALDLDCDEEEKELLQFAFMCPVCDTPFAPCTTLSDQIRAVTDAFRLIDADGNGIITLTDLRDIASWASDDSGTEFINNLVQELQTWQMERGMVAEEDTPISGKDFVLAFARCLSHEEAEMEEILEQRADEYRKIGKLFGMERVQNHFSWNKFWLTLFSDALAPISFPLCKVLDWMQTDDDEEASFYDILTESQWLPEPHTSFDSFQHYLMTLWVPSVFSLLVFFMFHSEMDSISIMEVLSPFTMYIIIGTYIATISGYEHPKLVLRRLNMHLSSEVRQNELHAVFAFRAHTPEGHAVDQIGAIADVLFKNKFSWWSQTAAAFAGLAHGVTPMLHRLFMYASRTEKPTAKCFSPHETWDQFYTEMFYLLCGGHSWAHALVSIPAAAVSGYLTYRLLFITSVGFYNDLSFYYKLVLFRATTQAEPFLRYRARWLRAQRKMPEYRGRREFLQFLNLQKHDDLVLWCRIRHLLMDSYSGFKSKQGDIMVTFMLLWVLAYTSYIFFFQIGREIRDLGVFDLWARLDVFCFSLLLIAIINLKLKIHGLRKSDISLLHKEHYVASMSAGIETVSAARQAQEEENMMMNRQPYLPRRGESPMGSIRFPSRGPSRPTSPVGSIARAPFSRVASAAMPLQPPNVYAMGENLSEPQLLPPPERFRRGSRRGSTAVQAETSDQGEQNKFNDRRDIIREMRRRPSVTDSEPEHDGPPGYEHNHMNHYAGEMDRGWESLEEPEPMYGQRDPGVPRRLPNPINDMRRGMQQNFGWNEDENAMQFGGQWPPQARRGGLAPPKGIESAEVVQSLLEQTARFIQEFDRPPRLLSFTVSIHFLRYIFLPLLSPVIALFRSHLQKS